MHVYVYKESHCDKDKMKPSKKFEVAFTLIGIVLGGRRPGGQLSQQEVVQVQLSGANFPRRELSGV